MRRSRFVATVGAVLALAAFAADAQAVYHPTMGRFMSRDPGPGAMMEARAPRTTGGPAMGGAFVPRGAVGPYHDGMNLYQYCRSTPGVFVDPTGLAVSGRLLYDTETVHATTAAWKAVRTSSSYGGQTVSNRLPAVAATYTPASPCCCTFHIEAYDYGVTSDVPGVGVVYADGFLGIGRATMTAALVATVSLHEGYHRADHIAVWRKYIGILTDTRTCCYTRGLWIFTHGDAQSTAECDDRAKLLEEYLIDQLRDYQHAVADQIDSRVTMSSPAAAHTAAHTAATTYAATMAMRDWSCDDTVYWFYP